MTGVAEMPMSGGRINILAAPVIFDDSTVEATETTIYIRPDAVCHRIQPRH